MGFRILMTNRHDWDSLEIVQAYHGQATIEQAFKNIINPYHLALKPGFHWTDQKIKVHYFCCVLGYLLAALIWKRVRTMAGYDGTLDNLLDELNRIRLSTILNTTGKAGKPRVIRKIEEMTKVQARLANALDLAEIYKKPIRPNGLSVYM